MIFPDNLVLQITERFIMEKRHYLGIDVSKGYADFTILNQEKKIVEENFQLDDTFEGHQELFNLLKKHFAKHSKLTLYCAVESTGGYENNWYNSLHKYQLTMNLFVARLNPLGVHHSSKAALNRITTDKESAKNVAEYLISYPEKVDYQREPFLATAKRVWTFITLLKKQKTQLFNELESILYIANPEIIPYCSDGLRIWTLKLLEKYPTAKHIARAKVESISKIPYISKSRANDLIDNAKKSVASGSDETSKEIIISLVKQISSLKMNINKHLKILESNIDLPNEIEILKSFDGIGTYSAVGLMLEIGSIERFSSSKKIASFFGVHPAYRESGDGRTTVRMSKKGRKQPRHILFNVTRYGIAHNDFIKYFYAKHLKKGMAKRAAMGAIMYKILRIIYGMLKNRKPFDAQIDRNNRMKIRMVEQSSDITMKRRLQAHDNMAPISKRQAKKRKEKELLPK